MTAERLPDEILCEILTHLKPVDACIASCACSQWRTCYLDLDRRGHYKLWLEPRLETRINKDESEFTIAISIDGERVALLKKPIALRELLLPEGLSPKDFFDVIFRSYTRSTCQIETVQGQSLGRNIGVRPFSDMLLPSMPDRLVTRSTINGYANVTLYDTSTGNSIYRYDRLSNIINPLFVQCTDRYMVISGTTITIVDLSTGELYDELSVSYNFAYALKFLISDNGRIIVFMPFMDNILYHYDIETKQTRKVMLVSDPEYTLGYFGFEIDSKAEYAVVARAPPEGGSDNILSVVSLVDESTRYELNIVSSESSWGAVFTFDSEYLVVASRQSRTTSRISIFKTKDWALTKQFEIDVIDEFSLNLSYDGKSFLVYDESRMKVLVYSVIKGDLQSTIESSKRIVYARFAKNKHRIIVVDSESVSVWSPF